jgi:type I restriction enzyme S subunit
LRAKKNIIIPKLIHYILIYPVHKNKLLSVGEDGGATRQALTKAQLLEYEINFPSSLSSQLKLVEKISNFYSYTFLIKNNYDEKIRNFPSLKQSILQQAFSGELVKD